MTSWVAGLQVQGWAWLDHIAAADAGSALGRASSPARLAPKAPSEARPWSLSGAYGLDAFPWHTDGAISSNPPRWLLLEAVELSNSTWTELLVPDADTHARLRRTTLRAIDQLRQVRYLPAVVPLGDGNCRLRWDPRICTPRTGLSIEELGAKTPTSRVEWQMGGILVIDNFRVMHRRPAVHEQNKRVLERTYVWEH